MLLRGGNSLEKDSKRIFSSPDRCHTVLLQRTPFPALGRNIPHFLLDFAQLRFFTGHQMAVPQCTFLKAQTHSFHNSNIADVILHQVFSRVTNILADHKHCQHSNPENIPAPKHKTSKPLSGNDNLPISHCDDIKQQHQNVVSKHLCIQTCVDLQRR